MIPVKLKKYTFKELKGRLSNGKDVLIVLNEYSKGVHYDIDINIIRADLKGSFSKKKYDTETYILTIEKHDSRYTAFDTECLIDEKLTFIKLEEVVDYLERKKFIKKKEWIINEKEY